MRSIILFIVSFLLAPLFSAIILKVKAFFGGRKGPSIFINYYTLAKLFFHKSSVYSETTTFIFRLGPIVSFAVILVSLLFFPFAHVRSVFAFEGDILFLIYLLGLGRFLTIIAALDTGSSFEGMGASREAWFSILAELTLFMIFIFLYKVSASISFSGALATLSAGGNLYHLFTASLVLIMAALFMVLLSENCRVPVDDPATHLELTMIHEVMVLDHSGPELGLIQLGADLKLVFYASFIACLLLPFSLGNMWLDILSFYSLVVLIYIFIGIIESIIPRFRFIKVAKFLLASFALAFFANIIIFGGLS